MLQLFIADNASSSLQPCPWMHIFTHAALLVNGTWRRIWSKFACSGIWEGGWSPHAASTAFLLWMDLKYTTKAPSLSLFAFDYNFVSQLLESICIHHLCDSYSPSSVYASYTRIIEYRWMHRPGDTGQLCQCGSHGLSALTRAWSRSQKAEGPPTRSWDLEDVIFSFFLWYLRNIFDWLLNLFCRLLSPPVSVCSVVRARWLRGGGRGVPPPLCCCHRSHRGSTVVQRHPCAHHRHEG